VAVSSDDAGCQATAAAAGGWWISDELLTVVATISSVSSTPASIAPRRLDDNTQHHKPEFSTGPDPSQLDPLQVEKSRRNQTRPYTSRVILGGSVTNLSEPFFLNGFSILDHFEGKLASMYLPKMTANFSTA